MQFKPIPEAPGDLEAVESILGAVPTTAGAVDDCCARLVEETRLEARSEAETWLTFLRALELVTEESAGYRRRSSESRSDGEDRRSGSRLEPEQLRQPFRERVYGVDTVLEVLERADGPLAVTDVAEAMREERSVSERRTRIGAGRFETAGTERVRRLLEWGVRLGLVDRTADGDRYRPATGLE